MSLCLGCSRRPQLHDVGLCAECWEEKVTRKGDGPATDEERLDVFKALVVHVVDGLRRPDKETTLKAFLGGKAAITISAYGVTIDPFEPPKVDGVLRREQLN